MRIVGLPGTHIFILRSEPRQCWWVDTAVSGLFTLHGISSLHWTGSVLFTALWSGLQLRLASASTAICGRTDAGSGSTAEGKEKRQTRAGSGEHAARLDTESPRIYHQCCREVTFDNSTHPTAVEDAMSKL